MRRIGSGDNPLASDDPGAWNELIDSIGPASLLVVIERRMGLSLRDRYSAEDVLQEGLLCAWRDRAKVEWRGVRAFRSWVLSIIDNRIRDLADREGALKRGGGAGSVSIGSLGTASREVVLGSGVTTTPSRLAVYREQAEAMREALAGLGEDVREVVRLRLFEQRSVAEIASVMEMGESAVRHRFRKGADEYHRRLIASLAGSSTRDRLRQAEEEPPAQQGPDAAP